jgi:hypothetical protein
LVPIPLALAPPDPLDFAAGGAELLLHAATASKPIAARAAIDPRLVLIGRPERAPRFITL